MPPMWKQKALVGSGSHTKWGKNCRLVILGSDLTGRPELVTWEQNIRQKNMIRATSVIILIERKRIISSAIIRNSISTASWQKKQVASLFSNEGKKMLQLLGDRCALDYLCDESGHVRHLTHQLGQHLALALAQLQVGNVTLVSGGKKSKFVYFTLVQSLIESR